MNSIINEIKNIRHENNLNLDLSNNNRYRIVVFNNDGTKTAYCYSAPVYNEKTRKSVDLAFHKNGSEITATGSNTMMIFTDKLQVKNRDGICNILFDFPIIYENEKKSICGKNDIISMTTNGIIYTADMSEKRELVFEIEASEKYMNLMGNNGCISLMKEKFIPYLTVFCIGCLNVLGDVIAPAEIKCKRINENRLSIRIMPCAVNCDFLKFEINFFEYKVFQDTTVESLHPSKRNAFGGMAFIGNTSWFGKQWLYIRPELMKIADLFNNRINRVIIRLPHLNSTQIPIQAFKTVRRFCSFGSRWENKVPQGEYIGDLSYEDNYVTLDITDLVLDKNKNCVFVINGILIKAVSDDTGFAALATGDNYYMPPILEVNYRA